MLNRRFIINLLGFVLIFESFFMLLCAGVSLLYEGADFFALLISSLITLVFGITAWYPTRKVPKDLIKREGFIVVTMVWVLMSVFGALPYMFHGAIPDFTDAFFETMSGFTTTGASILTDIEVVPHGLLFWRSMTHFIGGMGIIVLAIAVLPYFGFGGMQLYSAEASGVSSEKLHPRITKTAKSFWGIYLLLIALQTLLLMFGEMTLFDALCHSFGTVATGGFSTNNSSVADYSPYIQYVIIVFMILSGTNFTLHYYAINRKWDKIWSSSEYRLYLGLLLVASLIIAVSLIVLRDYELETAIRSALFQVTSIVTTTGFITDNYTTWPSFLTFIIFLLMFTGGCVGSTGGGIKIMRHNILFSNTTLEFKRMTHPQAVLPLRIGGKVIPKEVVFTVLAFVMLYLIIFTFSTLIMTSLGMSWESSMGGCASMLGAVGPGLGDIGNPVGNYSEVPLLGKWILSFLMLIGRLELFSVLILLSPGFWRNK